MGTHFWLCLLLNDADAYNMLVNLCVGQIAIKKLLVILHWQCNRKHRENCDELVYVVLALFKRLKSLCLSEVNSSR